MVGIDCHIGSQITEIGPYLDALDRVLDLVEAVEAQGMPLHHLDLGGGLGITYTDEQPPAAEALVRALLERIDARGHGQRKILFEPGRSLVGNAGVLLTEVLYLKPGDREELLHRRRRDERPDAPGHVPGLDGHGGLHAARRRRPQLMDVVGPVCESGDWLGRDRSLAVQPGDCDRRAVGRRLRHEHGEQLQLARPRGRGDGVRQRGLADPRARSRLPSCSAASICCRTR